MSPSLGWTCATLLATLTIAARAAPPSYPPVTVPMAVQSVAPNDLEITKDGGEVVVSAAWSVKVPVIANFSACLDFAVSTAK